jgi:hypothetical protein
MVENVFSQMHESLSKHTMGKEYGEISKMKEINKMMMMLSEYRAEV